MAESQGPVVPVTLHVEVPSGEFDCDLYRPRPPGAAPLLVVAHGFSRSKAKMADWGRRLAAEGLVVAVPTLPAWADHARNGKAIRELVDWLQGCPEAKGRLDANRLGLVGYSAGGLATILAATDEPRTRVWVGLDPVDRGGQGTAAAGRLKCPAMILRAEPQACNARGNAAGLHQALKVRNTCLLVIGATHTDPEWPTDALAERLCGQSSEERRTVFVQYAVAALRAELLGDPAATGTISRAKDDLRIRILTQPR